MTLSLPFMTFFIHVWFKGPVYNHFLFVVQSLSCVWFCNPLTCSKLLCPALSFSISVSLLKLMFVESVMPSNHLILCCPDTIKFFPLMLPMRKNINKGWTEVTDIQRSSVQFSRSVVSDSLRPHDRSTPGLPVHHQLPEFTQTHIHRVHDAIQPSHPRSSPSPPAPNPSQHQSLCQWVNSSHEVAKVLEFQL